LKCYAGEKMQNKVVRTKCRHKGKRFFLTVLLLLTASLSVFAVYDKTLIIRGDYDYPPFEYLNDAGEPEGFNVDIFRAVAKIMGLRYQISLDTWETVRNEIENRQADVLLGMYKSDERDKQVDFSIPHFISTYALFVRTDSEISSPNDIYGKKTGVQKDDIGYDYLLENAITDAIYTRPTIHEVLEELERGTIECALISRLQGLIIIKDEGLRNIKPVGNPVIQRNYCFAVPEGETGLLSVLNEGLTILKNSGQYDEIYNRWFGVYESTDLSWIVWTVFLLILLFSAFLAVILLWNWSLKKKVQERTAELEKSREDYRITLNSIGDAVISTDLNGQVSEMNPMAIMLTDFSPDQSERYDIGEIFNIIDLNKNEPVKSPIQEVKKTGNSIRYKEVALLSRNGNLYNISFICSPIRNKHEEITGFVLVFRNITEEYKQQEALRKREEQLRTLSNNISNGYIFQVTTTKSGADRDFLYLSEGVEKVHEISAESIMKDTALINSQVELSNIPDSSRRKKDASIELKAFKAEFMIRTPSGKHKWLLVNSTPRMLNADRILWDGLCIDISEQKKMERELKEAKDMAERSSNAKTEFLNNMSHELRTPLNGILGFSKILEETKLDELQKDYLGVVVKSGKHLLNIIKDILDLSKIESDEIEIQTEKTDLRELIEETAEIIRFKAEKKGLILKQTIPENVPESTMLDPFILRQILLNILGNAVKFTDTGEIEISVFLVDQDHITGKSKILFAVRDTGIGIKKENIPLITEAFSQEDYSKTRTYGGTGLGLAITKRLLEKMGTSLEIESTKGTGSIFSFVLELEMPQDIAKDR